MKLVIYQVKANELRILSDETAGSRLGFVRDSYVIDVGFAQLWLTEKRGIDYPDFSRTDLLTILQKEPNWLSLLKDIEQNILQEDFTRLQVEGEWMTLPMTDVKLLAPLSICPTIRSVSLTGKVTTQHDPSFYGDNTEMIRVQGANPMGEMAIACVIGKEAQKILVNRARNYIAGFCIVYRTPSIVLMGPWLVTHDELEDRRIGETWDLQMEVRVDGEPVLQRNLKSFTRTFPELVAICSKYSKLNPGEVILSDPFVVPVQTSSLRAKIEVEVEKLGVLRSRIR